MIKKSATKKDLVRQLAKKTGLDKEKVNRIVDLYFEEIKSALLSGKQVRLAGFGIFDINVWKSAEIYDINTKRKVAKQVKLVKFKPSSLLKEKIL